MFLNYHETISRFFIHMDGEKKINGLLEENVLCNNCYVDQSFIYNIDSKHLRYSQRTLYSLLLPSSRAVACFIHDTNLWSKIKSFHRIPSPRGSNQKTWLSQHRKDSGKTWYQTSFYFFHVNNSRKQWFSYLNVEVASK
jgi:hypothetical protein